ncbi:MAG: CehA/McbA family metallohydrolase, partial [Planctomycetota bacterium]
ARRGDYCVVAGQEDPRSTFGHIIGLNINKFVRDINTYDYYDIAFRNIHKQKGALVGFAHFSWNGCNLPRGFPWYVITGELDFIELLQFNAINRPDYYDYLNLGFKLTAAAGSDVPQGSTIGEARTYVYTGAKLDIDAWFAGIKKGNTFVSNGPALFFTVDDRHPGTEITKSPGDRVKVSATVLGHPKVGLPKALTIVGNQGVVKEIINKDKQTELKITLELPVSQSQWLVASTTCKNNAVAHTTPIYIKVNGRGTWCPKRGPAVIEKQLKGIAKIEKEVTGKTDVRSQGVLKRLEKAKIFYAKLNEKMQNYMDKLP